MKLEFDGLIAAMGETIVPAHIVVVRDFERPSGAEYAVSVEFDRHVFGGDGFDAFWAFARAREQFEPLGWKVAVQGASVRCFPSGMQGGRGIVALSILGSV